MQKARRSFPPGLVTALNDMLLYLSSVSMSTNHQLREIFCGAEPTCRLDGVTRGSTARQPAM
jgi:hypothetical protein